MTDCPVRASGAIAGQVESEVSLINMICGLPFMTLADSGKRAQETWDTMQEENKTCLTYHVTSFKSFVSFLSLNSAQCTASL